MSNPEIIAKWRAEFCEWILKEYLFEVKFCGNLLAVANGNPEDWTPLVIAQAGWKSWLAARESVEIELLESFTKTGAHMINQIVGHIETQGYRVRSEG